MSLYWWHMVVTHNVKLEKCTVSSNFQSTIDCYTPWLRDKWMNMGWKLRLLHQRQPKSEQLLTRAHQQQGLVTICFAVLLRKQSLVWTHLWSISFPFVGHQGNIPIAGNDVPSEVFLISSWLLLNSSTIQKSETREITQISFFALKTFCSKDISQFSE